MRPTRWWTLPIALALAGAVSYAAVNADHALLPDLSFIGPIALAVFGAAEAYVGVVTRARLAGRPGTRPIEPITVARLAALGKASAIVGAPLAGLYAGVLGRVLQLSSAVADHDIGVAAAGVGAGVALAAAGLWLESVCRVRNPPASGER